MPKKAAARPVNDMKAVRAARYHVTFRVVAAAEVHAPFTKRARQESPYRQALCELLKPDAEGKVLEFPSPNSRVQVSSHAKNLGIEVLFAEEGGKLYVRLVASPKVNQQILDFIKEKPRSKGEIEGMVFARKLELNLAAELQVLSSAGAIRLNSDSKWVCLNGARP